jgi:hypothetical protein
MYNGLWHAHIQTAPYIHSLLRTLFQLRFTKSYETYFVPDPFDDVAEVNPVSPGLRYTPTDRRLDNGTVNRTLQNV